MTGWPGRLRALLKMVDEFRIDLSGLHFDFQVRPLLIGGKAMQYYQLRRAGPDIDFVVAGPDYQRLAAQYPQHKKDLFGDLGVRIHA